MNAEDLNELRKIMQPIIKMAEDHDDRLRILEPMVHNHELILFGNREDRKDEGIVGLINKIEDLVENLKSWIKPIALSIIGWALLAGIQKVIAIAIELEKLNP